MDGAAPPRVPAKRQDAPNNPLPGDSKGAQATAEPWNVVARRKPKKPSSTGTQPPKDRVQKGLQPKAQERPRKPTQKEQKPKQGNQEKAVPKRRPPRTAAVTLTCPPDGYAEAMRVAQEAINLQDIGIKELRPKRAATGAIVLEVPGPNGVERASVLKDRMEEALKGLEGVRVARPVKTADLRVRDLLASATAEDVRGAISSTGGCTLQETRAGGIRMAPNGLGSLWVQCPLTAANRVVAAGRLKIGLTSSRVEVLEPRQLHCYRCLERGHVQSACPSSIDRSKLCYRCGQEGHVARFCANEPLCVLCRDSGKASNHRMGGRTCGAPRRNPKPLGRVPAAPVEGMEVEVTPPAVRGGPRNDGAAPVPVRRNGGKKEGKKPRPAVRGGPPLTGGAPAPARQGQEKDTRPAVRGGPSRSGGAPVPVRPGWSEGEDMEVEITPASPQPPLEQRTPRVFKGTEEPASASPSSPPQ